jgi:hypothetical protein
VKAWADAAGADTQLDLRSFELEVKCRNRFYVFRPRFLGQHEGRLFHSEMLVEHVTGFIGWLPYGALRTEFSDDKLVFKRFADAAGQRVPATWTPEAPQGDYLLKRSVGSFGYEITGPYRKGATQVRTPPEAVHGKGPAGTLFAEQFIRGRSLKVWYWGDTAFYAHDQAWPTVRGDGAATLEALAARRLGVPVAEFARSRDYPLVESSLAFQDLSPDRVLPQGREAWIDFRYGRTYQPNTPSDSSDNQLDGLPSGARDSVAGMGAALGKHLLERFRAPVLYALDGVLDPDGEVWWLEMNSNPLLPPDGYEPMFSSLFGAAKP